MRAPFLARRVSRLALPALGLPALLLSGCAEPGDAGPTIPVAAAAPSRAASLSVTGDGRTRTVRLPTQLRRGTRLVVVDTIDVNGRKVAYDITVGLRRGRARLAGRTDSVVIQTGPGRRDVAVVTHDGDGLPTHVRRTVNGRVIGESTMQWERVRSGYVLASQSLRDPSTGRTATVRFDVAWPEPPATSAAPVGLDASPFVRPAMCAPAPEDAPDAATPLVRLVRQDAPCAAEEREFWDEEGDYRKAVDNAIVATAAGAIGGALGGLLGAVGGAVGGALAGGYAAYVEYQEMREAEDEMWSCFKKARGEVLRQERSVGAAAGSA